MKNRTRVFLLTLMTVASAAVMRAQAPPQAATSAARGAQELATGWSALAGGKAAEAVRIADALLRATPRSHEAIALAIRARVASKNVTGALDTYESWLQGIARQDDVFLLEPVAMGVIETLAASTDPVVRTRALELLAAAGDATAISQLNAIASGTGSMRTDIALARRGDEAAVQRLVQQIKQGGGKDVSGIIDALGDGGVKNASGVIATALDPARPQPTKLAAARALADLGNAESIPALKAALKDPDPPVRLMAAAALSRLGDNAGSEILQTLENSPVGDLRLMAAEGSAPGNPNGQWVTVATGVLQDPDPLVRLRAAELIARYAADPRPGLEVLQQSLADTNPAMRSAAAQSFERLPAETLERDLATLRKLLRDKSPTVQLEAAGGILRASGAA